MTTFKRPSFPQKTAACGWGESNWLTKKGVRLCATSIVALTLPAMVGAETAGVFFDPDVEPIKFAAGDVKAALEHNKFTVEMLPVASLNTIDEKIEFWRKVMACAHSRGFDFYLVNWNIWTGGATGKYGITDDKKTAATSEATIAYMRKCMTALLETYPDLDGFGVTQGEHMSDHDANNSMFLRQTYGLGMADYARRHPERKMTFIHRWHPANFAEIKENFGELMELPHVKFQMSYKYSLAHMYSTPLPQRMDDQQIKPLRENKLRSWLTVRNDDFYYHNWIGDLITGTLGRDNQWWPEACQSSDGFLTAADFGNANASKGSTLGTAYCWWLKYANLMDSMYHGMTMPRTADLPHWHAHDQSVLKEYADLGGVETPNCNN